MKRLLILGLVGILMAQGLSGASTLTDFGTGQKEATASLRYPDCSDMINITLPAECHVLSAKMNVSTVAPDGDFPDGPVNASVMLDDTVLYEFNGTGYGGFGRQTVFGDGNETARLTFDEGGGTGNVTVRLPKSATVQSATMEVSCTGPERMFEMFNRTGDPNEVACYMTGVGDVNNDGYDDFAIPAPGNATKGEFTGVVYLYYGSAHPDLVADLVLIGNGSEESFGAITVGLGDVDGDGYDDIAIGTNFVSGPILGAGKVLIFLGGGPMDNISDFEWSGEQEWQCFGRYVAGGADVNGDGLGDLVVNSFMDWGGNQGTISVYFGGKTMNATPDVFITCPEYEKGFLHLPMDLPDLNGDGFDDVLVHAFNYGGSSNGPIYIYFGGKSMDNVSDLNMSENIPGTYYGVGIDTAGDVNGDGYEDLIVGSQSDPLLTEDSGAVYVYFGGNVFDSEVDITLSGMNNYDGFGGATSSAGDVDGDGFDDVLVGAPFNNSNGNYSGAFYFYYGGKNMDTIPDYSSVGNFNDSKGYVIAPAGDINDDGHDEFLIGSLIVIDGNTRVDGKVDVYFDWKSGLLDSSIYVGSQQVWAENGYYSGTKQALDFRGQLNDILKNVTKSSTDTFGNALVDVVLFISSGCGGNFSLGNLSIVYSYSGSTIDFSIPLNDYIQTHKNDKDAEGNLTIPIKIVSACPGRLELLDLLLKTDDAPSLSIQIPDQKMNEDSIVAELVDLHDYFVDDNDPSNQLNYSIVSVTNDTIIATWIKNNRYISIDASNGTQNDNWTGTVEVVVKCSDRWNSTTESNMFRVTVQNVPDPPAFLSMPPLNGTAGIQYLYQVMAVDGDMDPITYSLTDKPSDMTIDAKSGLIAWMPKAGGNYPVSINATDGQFNVFQNFSINVPNQYPNITSSPNTTAITTVPYEYLVKASDADGDNLTYSLISEIPGMTIDTAKGNVSWTPQTSGDYTVKIKVVDGKGGDAFQEFLIHVYEKVEPKMEFVSLPEKAKVEGTVNVSGRVINGSLNVVNVQYRLDSGEWVNLSVTENWELTLDTTKMKNGAHKLEIRVYDGQDYTEVATRSFTVSNPIKAAEQPFPIMPIAVILILAITAGGLLLWKGKRAADEEE